MLASCGGVSSCRCASRSRRLANTHTAGTQQRRGPHRAAAFKRPQQQQYISPIPLLRQGNGQDGWLDFQADLYDSENEDEVLEPTPPEPKYVNGRRVLVNTEIEAPTVRVQGPQKEDMGVFPFAEVYAEAMQMDLDVVMVNSGAEPPLVRLIKFGKYKFELERATKDKQKASKGVETKELRLRPVTEPHDYAVKLKQAQGFLAKGSRVKLTMNFSGRELRFKDQGKELILKFVEDLSGSSKVDGPLNLKTSTFTVTLAPK